jgi:protein gp37
MADSEIQWCDKVWNPVRGCRRVSPGCEHCYAERQAHRFSGVGQPYEGLTKLTKRGPVWTGVARFVPEMLDAPLRWKRPARIFVNSMSDLFHSDLTNEQIAAVFGIMGGCQRHTFQILTKRPERMKSWFDWIASKAGDMEFGLLHDACGQLSHIIDPGDHDIDAAPTRFDEAMEELMGVRWPLPNVWLGVSAEDQEAFDARIEHLMACPAAIQFLSLEPLLGPINIERFLYRASRFDYIWNNAPMSHDDHNERQWVIVGGESGPGSRPCDIAWIESIVEQCRTAGTKVFVKQLGARPYDSNYQHGVYAPHDRRTPTGPDGAGGTMAIGNLMLLKDRKGGDMEKWPSKLRVREMPEVNGA